MPRIAIQSPESISFSVFSLRSIPTPIEATEKANFPDFKHFVILLKISDLPKNLNNWVFEQFVVPTPQAFGNNWMTNRGITILADKLQFDNKTNLVKLQLTDIQEHGVVDGSEFLNLQSDEIIRLEIITGVTNKNNRTDKKVFPSDIAKAKQIEISVIAKDPNKRHLKLKELMQSANFDLGADVNCYDFLAKSPQIQKLMGLEDTFVFKDLTILRLKNQQDKDFIISKYGPNYLANDLVFFRDSDKLASSFVINNCSLVTIRDKAKNLLNVANKFCESEYDNQGNYLMYYSPREADKIIFDEFVSLNRVVNIGEERELSEQAFYRFYVNKKYGGFAELIKQKQSEFWEKAKLQDQEAKFELLTSEQMQEQFGIIMPEKYSLFVEVAKKHIKYHCSSEYDAYWEMLGDEHWNMSYLLGSPSKEKYTEDTGKFKTIREATGVYKFVSDYHLNNKEVDLKKRNLLLTYWHKLQEYLESLKHINELLMSVFSKDNRIYTNYEEFKDLFFDFKDIGLCDLYIEYLEDFCYEGDEDRLMHNNMRSDPSNSHYVEISHHCFNYYLDFEFYLVDFEGSLLTRYFKGRAFVDEFFAKELDCGVEDYLFLNRAWLNNVISVANVINTDNKLSYFDDTQFLALDYIYSLLLLDINFRTMLPTIMTKERFELHWNLVPNGQSLEVEIAKYPNLLGMYQDFVCSDLILGGKGLSIKSFWLDASAGKYTSEEIRHNKSLRFTSFGILNKDSVQEDGKIYNLGHKELMILFKNYLQNSEVLSQFGQINNNFLDQIKLQKLKVFNELSKNSNMYKMSGDKISYEGKEPDNHSVATKEDWERGKFEEQIAQLEAQIESQKPKQTTKNWNISQPILPVPIFGYEDIFEEEESDYVDIGQIASNQKLTQEEDFFYDDDENDRDDYSAEWREDDGEDVETNRFYK